MREVQYVNRWVITHINKDGFRTLTHAMQGRYTYDSQAITEQRIKEVIENNSLDSLKQIFGDQAIGTFEAREVKCYAGHHDPTTRWFDE